MNKTMEIKIGDFGINYRLENKNGTYYVTVQEMENEEIAKSGTFATSIDSEKGATELLNLLCENQVGAVHMADILCELGCAIE